MKHVWLASLCFFFSWSALAGESYKVQFEECLVDAKLINLATGDLVPQKISDVPVTGHYVKWKDGDITFSMNTSQTLYDGIVTPGLYLEKFVKQAGASESSYTFTRNRRAFLQDINDDYITKIESSDTKTRVSQKSEEVSIYSDISPGTRNHEPDYKAVKTSMTKPFTATKTVMTALGERLPYHGIQFKKWKSICTSRDSSLGKMRFRGFFKAVKASILRFDDKMQSVASVRKELASCQAASPGAACAEQNSKLAQAVKARDKQWANFIRASQLYAPAPSGSDSGSGGGWGGDGDSGPRGPSSGTTICSGSVCSGPDGTTTCSGNVCSGPRGTTICSGGVCSGPDGTTTCSGGVCSGPGGTTICSGGVCSGSSVGGAACGSGVACSQ